MLWILLAFPFVHGIRSLGWPETDGIVLAAEAERTVETDVRARRDHQELRIRYRYAVDETHYTGTRIRYGHERRTSEDATAFARRYPAGEHVPVYYNPGRPGQAVLQPGISLRSLALRAFAGLIFTIPPALGAIACFRYARRSAAST